jgi:hypothetical protein
LDLLQVAYEVVENVVDEVLIDVTVIYDVLTKHYLKMFLDASDKYMFHLWMLLTSVPVELMEITRFMYNLISQILNKH